MWFLKKDNERRWHNDSGNQAIFSITSSSNSIKPVKCQHVVSLHPSDLYRVIFVELISPMGWEKNKQPFPTSTNFSGCIHLAGAFWDKCFSLSQRVKCTRSLGTGRKSVCFHISWGCSVWLNSLPPGSHGRGLNTGCIVICQRGERIQKIWAMASRRNQHVAGNTQVARSQGKMAWTVTGGMIKAQYALLGNFPLTALPKRPKWGMLQCKV